MAESVSCVNPNAVIQSALALAAAITITDAIRESVIAYGSAGPKQLALHRITAAALTILTIVLIFWVFGPIDTRQCHSSINVVYSRDAEPLPSSRIGRIGRMDPTNVQWDQLMSKDY